MALYVAREGPTNPRIVVAKADPGLGADPDAFGLEYLEAGVDTDPILDASTRAGVVSVVDTKTLIESPAFADSEFFKSFLPLYGLDHMVVLYLSPKGGGPGAAVALFRGEGEPDFTDREKAFLRHSGPVLAHSFDCALEAETIVADRNGRLSVLTERELEVARLAALGSRNDEIGEALHISPGTVKTHLRNVYSKLDVDSRVHLALRLAGH
jgi:DNA-binding CsgD family transcriptional regulator